MSLNNAIVCLTQNHKLSSSLNSALKDSGLAVIRSENFDAVNNAVKHNAVGAIVLHIKDSNGWILFELIKTSFPLLPVFAILAPSLGDDEQEIALWTKQYGAAAIITERQGIRTLATLITSVNEPSAETSGKDAYLQTFGELEREMARLQKEMITTAMRTLPQPVIGDDSLRRLRVSVALLKEIKIKP